MVVSEHERTEGFSQERLAEAVASIKENGYVVLENVLDREYVRQMKDKLLEVFEKKRQRTNIEPSNLYSLEDYPGVGGNHGFNRWNLRLPSCQPFIDSRLLGNPIAHNIFNAFFNKSPVFPIIACDMNAPGSTFQALHRDRSTFALIMNVPLVDMTMENGATHIFPGTHCMPGKPFQDHGPQMYCPKWPPASWKGEFLCVKAGAVVIRDVRMAHRGMANHTDEFRPLININVCTLEHEQVPFHCVSSLFERMARKNRQKSLENSNDDALFYWNGIGQKICNLAKTDRIERRAIELADWQALNEYAQQTLRYAQIKGESTEAYKNARALKPTLLALQTQWEGMKLKKLQSFQQREQVGLVDPSETRLIAALSHNDHDKEDVDIILTAMKQRGIDI